MKILHTADIHLKTYGDQRWQTLQGLLEIAEKENVGVLAISGDLFDKNVDAENLRPKIREIFSGNPFDIVLVPGNHDFNCYKDMYFGEDVTALTELDQTYDSDEIRICGIPFQTSQGVNIIDKIRFLAGKLDPDKRNIVLYHGELLDAFFSRTDFGDEGQQRYAPIKLSYFGGLNIDYVLAGHFHTRFDVRKIENGGYFVYPGSPVSITKKEIGLRKVNLFEVGNPPKEYQLDSPHYENIVVELDPYEGKIPIDLVIENLEQTHPQAQVILTVKGYFNSKQIGTTESELTQQIDKIAEARCVDKHLDFLDIHRILENDLYKSFLDQLESADFSEQKKKAIREITVRAMMKVEL